MWKFLGQGLNLHHTSDNAKSLTTRPPGNSYSLFSILTKGTHRDYRVTFRRLAHFYAIGSPKKKIQCLSFLAQEEQTRKKGWKFPFVGWWVCVCVWRRRCGERMEVFVQVEGNLRPREEPQPGFSSQRLAISPCVVHGLSLSLSKDAYYTCRFGGFPGSVELHVSSPRCSQLQRLRLDTPAHSGN